ncbi:MAG: hypothetical protein RSC13_08225, partial [Clostridium sp.]
KPDLIGMGDTAKDEHSYIRRTLFNRGPFKVVPRAAQMQDLNRTKTPPEMWEELNKKIANTVERVDNYKAAPQTHDNTRVEAVDPVRGVDIISSTLSMPDFEGNKDLLIRIGREIKAERLQMFPVTDEIIKGADSRLNLKFDIREASSMAWLIPPGPDHNQKAQEMCRDFISDDPVRKKPWLDMLYDLRDSTVLSNLDLSNPADVRKMSIAYRLNQVTSALMATEKDYCAARYPTQKQVNDTKLLDHVNYWYGISVGSLLTPDGVAPTDDLYQMFPSHHYGSLFVNQTMQASIYNYRVGALGEKFDKIPFLAPPILKLFLGKGIDDIQLEDEIDSESEFTISETIRVTFKTLNIAEVPGCTREDLIFIDGKSVNEIVDEKNMTLNPKERSNLSEKIIATALVNGKNRISTISLTTDENGKVSSHLQDVKPDLTKLGETNSYEYSPRRIKLSNWGLTKCITPAERVEKLYATPLPADMCAKMQQSVNTKVQQYTDQLVSDEVNTHRIATNVKAISATIPQPNLKRTSEKKTVEHTKTEPDKEIKEKAQRSL